MDVPISYSVIGLVTFFAIFYLVYKNEEGMTEAERVHKSSVAGAILKIIAPFIGTFIVLSLIRDCY